MSKLQKIFESKTKSRLMEIFDKLYVSKLQNISESKPEYTLQKIFGYNPRN